MDDIEASATKFTKKLTRDVISQIPTDLKDSYEDIDEFFKVTERFGPSDAHHNHGPTRYLNEIAADPNPPEYPMLIEMYTFRVLFGHTYLTLSQIQEIKKFIGTDTVIEVGAGNGYVGHALKLSGVDIVLTDVENDQNVYPARFMIGKQTWTSVEHLNHIKAMKKYGCRDCLLLIWPPPDHMASQTIQLFEGNKLVYIGEGMQGDCANNEFFLWLSLEWKLEAVVELKHFIGSKDTIYLYTRC